MQRSQLRRHIPIQLHMLSTSRINRVRKLSLGQLLHLRARPRSTRLSRFYYCCFSPDRHHFDVGMDELAQVGQDFADHCNGNFARNRNLIDTCRGGPGSNPPSRPDAESQVHGCVYGPVFRYDGSHHRSRYRAQNVEYEECQANCFELYSAPK